MALHCSIPFDPDDPLLSLSVLPETAGVFALYPADPAAEPYLGKTPNLRRRLSRLLRSGQRTDEPGRSSAGLGKRLQLAHLVRRIEYSITGSEFESALCLYQASTKAFGERARRRLRLRPPTFLRISLNNPYPRVYATTRIATSAASSLFGPFPSRAAAERYQEEMLSLFLLRRCHDDLHPDPTFPGCAYSEMKMCLAPCYKGCSDERYREETAAVLEFLETSGSGLLGRLESERNAASEDLEFERAANVHQRMQKVQAVSRLAGEAIRPLARLSGVLVQPAAETEHVALFALDRGFLRGPVPYSIQGMRLPNPRSGSTSLFPQPLALEPVPLEGHQEGSRATLPANPKSLLDSRLETALEDLQRTAPVPASVLPDHLALLTRWLALPPGRRVGEIVFAESDGQAMRKPLLRAIARVAARAASPASDLDPSNNGDTKTAGGTETAASAGI